MIYLLEKRIEVIMSEIVIRKIKSEEVQFAMDLALEVFMQFEAPDLSIWFL